MEDDTEKTPSPKKPDYEVGYGKPPKSGQFKKGQSGNRKGRPKGARGLKTDLKAELGKRVTITENGRQRMLTMQQLMVRQLTTGAGKGDLRAIAQIMELIVRVLGVEGEVSAKAVLSAEDEEILAEFLRQAGGSTQAGDQNEP